MVEAGIEVSVAITVTDDECMFVAEGVGVTLTVNDDASIVNIVKKNVLVVEAVV